MKCTFKASVLSLCNKICKQLRSFTLKTDLLSQVSSAVTTGHLDQRSANHLNRAIRACINENTLDSAVTPVKEINLSHTEDDIDESLKEVVAKLSEPDSTPENTPDAQTARSQKTSYSDIQDKLQREIVYKVFKNLPTSRTEKTLSLPNLHPKYPPFYEWQSVSF